MRTPAWLIDIDQLHSSYLILLTLVLLGVVAAALYVAGLLGASFSLLGRCLRCTIQGGFLVWRAWFAGLTWPVFLAVVLGLLAVGVAGVGLPWLTLACAVVPLFMGVTACLAYMFIDLERYEVERGYKAVHNPLKGQVLAVNLARYGPQVGLPLLAVATVGVVGGFALLNEGLYESVGAGWYTMSGQGEPVFVDFLAYALINLLRVVDVLDVAESQHFLRVAHVHQARWPAGLLLAVFRTFFTLVLLQQLFASVRQGGLLADTITDFWSPHEPIHERARNALPQYGAVAITPLLVSLRGVAVLTKEQREQLPQVLAAIGPSTALTLIRHLNDPHEHVRAIAAGALGQLHAPEAVPWLVPLAQDPSEMVRQVVAEALGALGSAGDGAAHRKRKLRRAFRERRSRLRRLLAWHKPVAQPPRVDPIGLAVATVRQALADPSAAVRTQAALALGRIGPAAAVAAPALREALHDADETVRCQAAEAVVQVGGPAPAAVAALAELLQDPSAPVKASAARALGALKKDAAPALPALVALLQDRDEAVRTAAAEAVGRIGPLNEQATGTLVEGLASADNVVRAHTAEALGTIGEAAAEAAPALARALADSNDRVRAKAAAALGKIGEAAADVAVPSLVRVLRDADNWVSALAAEALGQMGELADEAVPALVRALGHVNPLVRANAAEALGKLGPAATGARAALEKAAADADAGVRGQAVRALGAVGPPARGSEQVVLAELQDADPQVRAAAVEAVGQWGDASPAALAALLPLLEDANDQVKVQVTRVLPQLAGGTPAAVDGLCRLLLEDDSAWVQAHAAAALGKLGPAAAAAGAPLARAAQTADVSVREQAMRALALIQPPEAALAFAFGLKDGDSAIRKLASAGWMKAAAVPEEVIPALVEALHDPEVQVRANAANALGRLDTLPAAAVPFLTECAGHGSDGLRINAAMALRRAPAATALKVLGPLVEDPNPRVRLIAAGAVLAADPAHTRAREVLAEALKDPTARVRKAALELVEALGDGGTAFADTLKERSALEQEPELRETVARLAERSEPAVGAERPAVIGS
jgi:HEAT repeat protein